MTNLDEIFNANGKIYLHRDDYPTPEQMKRAFKSFKFCLSVTTFPDIPITDEMMVDYTTQAETDAVRAENIELLARLKAARGALADIFDGQPQWPDNAKKELMWCRKRAKEAYRVTGDAP